MRLSRIADSRLASMMMLLLIIFAPITSATPSGLSYTGSLSNLQELPNSQAVDINSDNTLVAIGYNGVLNSLLIWLEMITEPVTFLLYNANAVVIALTHGWAPFAILPIFVSLEKIDRSLLEASRDLGDGPVHQFFRVILPLSAPGVIGAALIIFIPGVL